MHPSRITHAIQHAFMHEGAVGSQWYPKYATCASLRNTLSRDYSSVCYHASHCLSICAHSVLSGVDSTGYKKIFTKFSGAAWFELFNSNYLFQLVTSSLSSGDELQGMGCCCMVVLWWSEDCVISYKWWIAHISWWNACNNCGWLIVENHISLSGVITSCTFMSLSLTAKVKKWAEQKQHSPIETYVHTVDSG